MFTTCIIVLSVEQIVQLAVVNLLEVLGVALSIRFILRGSYPCLWSFLASKHIAKCLNVLLVVVTRVHLV